jgi:hypothetical protein
MLVLHLMGELLKKVFYLEGIFQYEIVLHDLSPLRHEGTKFSSNEKLSWRFLFCHRGTEAQ